LQVSWVPRGARTVRGPDMGVSFYEKSLTVIIRREGKGWLR
jgi:hypothetical protein